MLQELNSQEMNEVKGGVSQAEYCATLGSLLNDENLEWWTEAQLDAWVTAYFTHCIEL